VIEFSVDNIDSSDWERRYCVLAKEERRLYFNGESEVRVRLLITFLHR